MLFVARLFLLQSSVLEDVDVNVNVKLDAIANIWDIYAGWVADSPESSCSDDDAVESDFFVVGEHEFIDDECPGFLDDY